MIDRICISINNRCNLHCKYCHFHEKQYMENRPMDVFEILDHVKEYAGNIFKIGFVGNGEAFLDFEKLKDYILYIEDSPNIKPYTITNGTIDLSDSDWKFLNSHGVTIGLSVDGPKELHDKNRCGSFQKAMQTAEHIRRVTGRFPTWNATVGRDTLRHAQETINFFRPFGTRVTFSRMIGKCGISLDEYHDFIAAARNADLSVRKGGNDCTMYGGHCGAGENNFFFANGKVYLCGNCVDLAPIAESGIRFQDLEHLAEKSNFDRTKCYKETFHKGNVL